MTLKRGMKMERRKTIIAILTATLIAISIFSPTLLIKHVEAVDPSGWYMNVSGVLSSDTYALYPFDTDKSLKIGFSKFGEMIDSINNIGLEYGDRDPFAPAAGSSVPAEISKNKWFSGWLINITYFDGSSNRNVWAEAQHADKIDYGKDWIRVHSGYGYSGCLNESQEDPRQVGKLISTGVGPVNGGRKTNGTATTDDIRVLYNGPRMFIARTVTHIFDWDSSWSSDEPLVDIVFTLIFNKDKKEVIVLKDIKEATTKYVFGTVTVPIYYSNGIWVNGTINGAVIQFSNRGEWDLGPANSYDSYVHFYTAGNGEPQSTVYNWNENMTHSYHLNPTLPAAPWFNTSDYGSQPGTTGTYDVAQIVAKDLAYVGWAAFWPSLSNWHVDAGYQNKWWHSLGRGESATDSALEPFMSPNLIGEWDFALTKTRFNCTSNNPDYPAWREFDRQFRGVTVYGVTDDWTGDDDKRTGTGNVLDEEVKYQLEEIFAPWDLYSAIHVDTRRWVEFHNVTTTEKTAADAGTNLNITLTHRPVRYSPTWEDYCNFSERVMWGGALKHPARSVYYSGSDLSVYEPYELYVNATGYGNVTILAASVPAAGTVIKILYSTNCTVTYDATAIQNYFGGSLSLGNDTLTVTNGQKGTIVPSVSTNTTSWRDPFDIVQNITILYDEFVFNIYGTPYSGQVLTGSDDLNITVDIKIPPEGGYVKVYNSTYFAYNITASGQWNVTNSGNMTVMYKINPPNSLSTYAHEYVHITGSILIRANHTLYYSSSTYRALANYTIASASLTKEIMGRYEWVVVGNHSRAIDSVGAAMVSEAFKEKQVIADDGGLDMKDMWGTNIPYLLSNLGNATWRAGGPAWTSIYDSLGRLAYIDDWCTRYPVSSSNIITVAGPSANLFSEYFNEFSQAIQIYGITSGNLIDVIFAPTCWNTTKASNYLGQYYYSDGQFYRGNTTTGIGVITTYKDINGTVGFMIYGWSGDDTYYTCRWFQEYGAYYLQTENLGVTTLIVRLNYQNVTAITSNPRPPNYQYDAHFPYVQIVERLGTISEKMPHDP